MADRSEPLRAGVWGVLATPFVGPTLEVDEFSLLREVHHYVRIGATGLTVLGVFGEAARLSVAERRKVVAHVAEASEGLQLVVGLTSLATAPAIEECAMAADVARRKLSAVMVQVNTADPSVLARHLTAIHRATGVGIVIQDYPTASGVSIHYRDLAKVVREVPAVVAVKSECPPSPVAIAALTKSTPVTVFGGLGGVSLLDELAAGAAGAMTGFSYPEALVATVCAWEEGGFERAREVLAPWLPLVNFEAQPGISLAIRKECLRARELIAQSRARPPSQPLPAAMLPLLQQHIVIAEQCLRQLQETE